MDRFKVAVIGCGAVSRNHGKALKNNSFASLEYCVDIVPERAQAFSETYGGKPLTDYRDLYGKGLDAVHVVTPHNTHPQIVMDLLDHGLNVFCEKPLAITPAEAKMMFRKSEETDSLLAAVNEALQALREDGTLSAISEKYFNGLDLTKGSQD